MAKNWFYFALATFFVVNIAACVPGALQSQSTLPEEKSEPSAQETSPLLAVADVGNPLLLEGLSPSEMTMVVPEELTEPEPDQTLVEEVELLESLGEWEEGTAASLTQKHEVEYDFPITMNKQVEFYLDFFQHKQHATFKRWLERSGKYLPLIQKQLGEAGLPLDLAYLPMIESGFSLTAYSKARAVGPWQFIRATGKHYGLRIDNHVDERRDPVKSTRAAVAFLAELYEEFGSWHLAVAGYNAGAGAIQRAMRRTKKSNFWDIAKTRYLSSETKRYVPKLIAAIIVAKNPEKYGFTDLEYQSPFLYEEINVPRWTSLKAVSIACETEFEQLRNYNRELRQAITPPGGSYSIKVPVGKKERVAANLPRVHTFVTTQYKTHVVRKGESLKTICRTYNLRTTTMLKANNLRKASIFPGQRLRIPYQSVAYRLLAENEIPGKSYETGSDSLVLHTIKPGETVSSIADRYNVPSHMIVVWNDIQNIHKIRAGQQLSLYLQNEEAKIVSADENSSHRIIFASKQKKSYRDTQDSNIQTAQNVTYYEVKGGDSLWEISQKFNLTPQDIMEWNNLKDNLIKPGLKLLIKLSANDVGV